MQRWRDRARALKAEVHALLLACRDPRVPLRAKVVVFLVVACAVSPIDPIPDFIPVLGYLDDLILLPLGILLAVKMIPAEVMDDCRARAGDALPANRARAVMGVVIVVVLWSVLVFSAVLLGKTLMARQLLP